MKAFKFTETCIVETVVLADDEDEAEQKFWDGEDVVIDRRLVESISYDDPIEVEHDTLTEEKSEV
jgi:hypothetical protein